MSFSLCRIICYSHLFCPSQMIGRNEKLFFHFFLLLYIFPQVSFILVTHFWIQHLLHERPSNPEVVCESQGEKYIYVDLCSFLSIVGFPVIKKMKKYCYFPTISSSHCLKLFLCLTLEHKCPLSIEQEDITAVNMYAQNNKTPNYIKQKLTELKEEIDNPQL